MLKNFSAAVGVITMVFVVASFCLNMTRTVMVDKNIRPLQEKLDICLRHAEPY